MSLTYVSQSSIPNLGKGLFARKTIKKGAVIAEFKGKIFPKGVEEKKNDNDSMIDFQDGFVLVCDESDEAASFANDFIQFPTTRRKLMESLRSNEPFYSMQPHANRNSAIELDIPNHRAFLTANKKIQGGEEIFAHFGFIAWFMKEVTTLGFLQEQEIDEHGFPETFHQYPGFISYLKLVYPNYVSISAHIANDYSGSLICVTLKDGKDYCLEIPNYKPYIDRVSLADLEAL
jgi:hypothetical protein